MANGQALSKQGVNVVKLKLVVNNEIDPFYVNEREELESIAFLDDISKMTYAAAVGAETAFQVPRARLDVFADSYFEVTRSSMVKIAML